MFVTILSVTAWRSYIAVIGQSEGMDVLAPFGWFSLLWGAFLVGAVVWERVGWQLAAAGAVALPSVWFEPFWGHAVVAVITAGCFFVGLRSVQKEVSERVRFRFLKDIAAGYPMFFFALAAVLSSAYYVHLRDARWEELVPRFRLGEGMAAVAVKAFGLTNPELRELSDRSLTVDEFLSAVQSRSADGVTLVGYFRRLYRCGAERDLSIIGKQ